MSGWYGFGLVGWSVNGTGLGFLDELANRTGLDEPALEELAHLCSMLRIPKNR